MVYGLRSDTTVPRHVTPPAPPALPHPGVGKVPGEGKKRMVRWCPCNKILKAHHVAMGPGGGRATWISLPRSRSHKHNTNSGTCSITGRWWAVGSILCECP